MKNDPYTVNGAVKRWHVREWSTVVGRLLKLESLIPNP
jgi:hypothetical protein